MVKSNMVQILYLISLNFCKRNFEYEILEKYFFWLQKSLNFHWKSRPNKLLILSHDRQIWFI